jgi:predicted RecA/RadA family phage recombinase
MARTFRQPGAVLNWVNGSGAPVVSGEAIALADIVAIAQVDIPIAGEGAISIEGVHQVPKASGAAWAVGQKIHFNSDTGNFTHTSPTEGVDNCGVAVEVAASGATVGFVKLTPGTGTVQSA